MAVPAGPTEQRYVGNGVSTIFTVPFLVIQASDLAVYVDGDRLTSGYTQSGVGNPTSSVTFNAAPAVNAQILLTLEVPFERLNDYQENGDFLADTVNNDFDRIWQALKQLFRYSDRSLRLGQFDVDGQGWYRAKGNGIRDLADPVEAQDAATKNWAQQYIAGILEAGQGPINNAANIVYVDADSGATTVQKAILKQFSSVASLRQKAGDKDKELAVLASYHAGPYPVGGGQVRWSASSTAADNGYDTFAVAGVSVGRWVRVYDNTLDLYQFGGTYQGDCIAAMDAALASPVETIKVPDGVILGYHVFDAPAKKVVIGGRNNSFSTFPSGIYPRVCKDIEIREFRDLVMAMHPITGGDIATAQLFVGLASGATIGDMRVAKNTGSGGRLAISVAFENNGRTLTGMALIYENEFVDQQGQEGGEGYGIHVANETDVGDIFVMRNKITRAGRHSFYFARNRGGGRMISWGNTAIDHRFNATTQGTQQRGAFQITRSKNVLSLGDMVDGYFDGAMQISEENESPGLFDAADIIVRDPIIRKPYNNTPGIYIGYGVPFAGSALTRSILIDGLRYYSGASLAPAIQYTRGRNVRVINSHLEYLNVASGTIRPIQILGDTAANSGNLLIKDTFVYCRGCSGANLRVMRLTGNCLTTNIPIDLDGLVMDSDAATNQALDPSGTITNTAIKISGMALTGWTGANWPQARPDPSQVWNGQFITSGIATPVGNVVPNFIGQDCYLQSNGTFWKAFGLTNTSWKQTA